jgi:flagellar protein FliS
MLVVKMYEGAIRFSRAAQRAHVEGNISTRGLSISKVLAIVTELQSALDFEQGAEIAENLDRLYTFVTDKMIEANISGRMESIDEAVGIMETLKEAWVEIAAMPPAQKVVGRSSA